MVSGITESDNHKLVDDLMKMSDLSSTEKIQLRNKKENEEDRWEMFISDMAKVFQLVLEDTGLDTVISLPPAEVKYAAVCTEDEEEIVTFRNKDAMTPQSKYSQRPSLASSDASPSSFLDDDIDWLSPKSEHRRNLNDSLLHDPEEFYFDLSKLDDDE